MKVLCMVNKIILIISCCSILINCFHGRCWRSVKGSIRITNNENNYIIEICRYYETDNYYPDCNTVALNGNGEFCLSRELYNGQSDCYNDCLENNSTIPDRIKLKVIFLRSEGDTIVKDTTFPCDDFLYSGDDITLPEIELK